MDWGESVHEGLKRELHEEIALTSEFRERLVDMHTRWLEGKQAWLMWLVYEIDYDELEFSLGEHGDETIWMSSAQLDETDPNHSMILETLRKVQADELERRK